MGRKLTALVVAGGLMALGGAAIAHHSFAMFDQENPLELAGSVQDFKFTSPHTFILLKVSKDGKDVVWNLEGASRARWCVMAGPARPSSRATS